MFYTAVAYAQYLGIFVGDFTAKADDLSFQRFRQAARLVICCGKLAGHYGTSFFLARCRSPVERMLVDLP